MSDAVIEYRDEDTGTVFRWHGGAYIDAGWRRKPDDPTTDASREARRTSGSNMPGMQAEDTSL